MTTTYGKGYPALRLDHLTRSTRHESLTGPAAATAAALRELPERYAAGLRVLERSLRDIDADQNATEAGKVPRRAQAVESWRAGIEQVVREAQKRADNARQNRENRVLPTPLHTDAGVAQARLANARSDARMLLDPLRPTDIPARLEQLVGPDADPPVRHLLLVGNWFGMYASSRGAPGLGTEWEGKRRAHLGPLLSADGRAALAELDGLDDALQIPEQVASLFQADAAGRGLRITEL